MKSLLAQWFLNLKLDVNLAEAERLESDTLNLRSQGLEELPDLLEHLSRRYLHSVRCLLLQFNQLKTFSREACQNLENLKGLTLDYNRLEDLPFDFRNLRNLSVLNVSHNCFSGHNFFHVICQISTLKVLWANRTGMKEIPPEVQSLTNLRILGLRHNSIRKLPNELFALTKLRWLTLNENKIEEIPFEVDRLQRLVHLNLQRNRLMRLPITLNHLEELQFLFLEHNFLVVDKGLVEFISSIPKLKTCWLAGNLRDPSNPQEEPVNEINRSHVPGGMTPWSRSVSPSMSDRGFQIRPTSPLPDSIDNVNDDLQRNSTSSTHNRQRDHNDDDNHGNQPRGSVGSIIPNPPEPQQRPATNQDEILTHFSEIKEAVSDLQTVYRNGDCQLSLCPSAPPTDIEGECETSISATIVKHESRIGNAVVEPHQEEIGREMKMNVDVGSDLGNHSCGNVNTRHSVATGSGGSPSCNENPTLPLSSDGLTLTTSSTRELSGDGIPSGDNNGSISVGQQRRHRHHQQPSNGFLPGRKYQMRRTQEWVLRSQRQKEEELIEDVEKEDSDDHVHDWGCDVDASNSRRVFSHSAKAIRSEMMEQVNEKGLIDCIKDHVESILEDSAVVAAAAMEERISNGNENEDENQSACNIPTRSIPLTSVRSTMFFMSQSQRDGEQIHIGSTSFHVRRAESNNVNVITTPSQSRQDEERCQENASVNLVTSAIMDAAADLAHNNQELQQSSNSSANSLLGGLFDSNVNLPRGDGDGAAIAEPPRAPSGYNFPYYTISSNLDLEIESNYDPSEWGYSAPSSGIDDQEIVPRFGAFQEIGRGTLIDENDVLLPTLEEDEVEKLLPIFFMQ